MKLSFPTRKLNSSITKVKTRYRDIKPDNSIKAYGVTNKEGIVITGKEVSLDTSSYIVVGEKTFVYNPYRVNVGSIGISKPNFSGIVSPAYVVFKTKDDINNEFLFLYLKSPLGINLIKWYGDKGGVRSALGFNDLGEIDFPDLTYEQQVKALTKIKISSDKLDKMYYGFSDFSEKLTKLRQSILQDAIQGKLVPQDPKDEPAENLLEKIKADKKTFIKKTGLKKEKPLPSISPDEIPFELPNGWGWARLGDITASADYGSSSKADYNTQGIPMLRMNNIKNGKVDFKDIKYVSRAIEDLPRLYLKKGDLLFNRTNSYELVGKTGIYEKDDDYATFASYLIRLNFLPYHISSAFINIAMNSSYFRKSQIEPSIIQQNGQANFNGTKLKNTLIPLACLKEQQRIVEKVESLMKICDEQEKNIIEAKENINKLNQAILSEAFR